MAFEYSILTEITTIAAAAAPVYTNPAGKTTYIRLIVIHNGNTTVEETKLYNVPDNAAAVGTAGATNIFFDPSSEVGIGETLFIEFPTPGLILEDTNDTIQATTDTASKVTIQIFGGIE